MLALVLACGQEHRALGGALLQLAEVVRAPVRPDRRASLRLHDMSNPFCCVGRLCVASDGAVRRVGAHAGRLFPGIFQKICVCPGKPLRRPLQSKVDTARGRVVGLLPALSHQAARKGLLGAQTQAFGT